MVDYDTSIIRERVKYGKDVCNEKGAGKWEREKGRSINWEQCERGEMEGEKQRERKTENVPSQ